MGTVIHHAFLVTTSVSGIELIRQKAINLGMVVSECLQSPLNNYKTFAIAPDGSKEGRLPSDYGDRQRAEFRKALNEALYSDGSSPFSWVEVEYGYDCRANVINSDS